MRFGLIALFIVSLGLGMIGCHHEDEHEHHGETTVKIKQP